MTKGLILMKPNWKERALVFEYVLTQIQWMARRYAMGRRTYAVSMYNDALKKAVDMGFKPHVDTIEHPPTFWAEDGDYGWPKEYAKEKTI